MRTFIYSIAAIAFAAAAGGCSTKAGAQTPTPPARMLTADTDVNQLASGTITPPLNTGMTSFYYKVLDGPFVLTDTGGGGILYYAVGTGQDCTVLPQLDGVNARLVGAPTAGGRVFIHAGETLCVEIGASAQPASWSGFKPY